MNWDGHKRSAQAPATRNHGIFFFLWMQATLSTLQRCFCSPASTPVTHLFPLLLAFSLLRGSPCGPCACILQSFIVASGSICSPSLTLTPSKPVPAWQCLAHVSHLTPTNHAQLLPILMVCFSPNLHFPTTEAQFYPVSRHHYNIQPSK